jgi:hypothetical protein
MQRERQGEESKRDGDPKSKLEIIVKHLMQHAHLQTFRGAKANK